MSADPVKRPRGRPKLHEKPLSPAHYVAASLAALKASGGARKCFRFSAEAIHALSDLMLQPDAPATETEAVEKLLIDDKIRRDLEKK